MKIRIGFKTPDAVFYALKNLSEDEKIEAENLIKTWVEFGECLDVEVDTETKTCVVLPVQIRRNK